jgi:hypothetical protein
MVCEGEQPPKKFVEKVAREVEEEIARSACLGHRAMSLGMVLL